MKQCELSPDGLHRVDHNKILVEYEHGESFVYVHCRFCNLETCILRLTDDTAILWGDAD